MNAFIVFYCEACGVEIHREKWNHIKEFITDQDYCDQCQESYDKLFEKWKKSREDKSGVPEPDD